MAEYWTFGSSVPVRVADWARATESDGWDGMVFVDSQNLRMDCYVAMTIASCATSTLKVATGVTNPVTRHPAVSASSIAAIQATSGGRAIFGIGRGDSALAYVGKAPASLATFERYVRSVRTFLGGAVVPFDEITDGRIDLDDLHLRDQPDGSWLRWLDPATPRVPVEVIATGPKAIAVGGRHADIVTFTVGADEDRIVWGIEQARHAAEAAGRDPNELVFGAYLNVACHPDRSTACKLVAGGLASFARFAAMHGEPTGPQSADTAHVLRQIHSHYDMRHHGEPESSQTSVLSPEFIERYGIVGDVDACLERIRSIEALGVERIVVTPPNQFATNAYPDEATAAHECLVGGLLPALRSS